MKLDWNRRSFLNGLGGLAGLFAGGAKAALAKSSRATESAEAGKVAITGFGASGQVYEELGVKPIINGVGTMTFLGGSLISPEVEAVMRDASKHFVNIIELEQAAGRRISQMLKLPEGYSAIVTSGAAGAMVCGYAGILTHDNADFIQRLPDLTGMKSEVLIQKSHRYPFDHQVRQTGVKLIEVETREDVEKAIGPQTAALHFTNLFNDRGRIKVDEWLKIAQSHNLPAFNDAAADTPPISRLWEYAHMGYDLITFSGGKDIRGPQCAGLLMGKANYIDWALMNTSPNEDTIGRPCKVGKEEICGMVKALEMFLASDQEAMLKQYWAQLDYIAAQTRRIPGVSAAYHYDPHQIANHTVSMQISWDPRKISLSGSAVAHQMRSGNPSIYVGGGGSEEGGANTTVHITAWMLRPGEEKIVADRLVEVLHSGVVKA